MTRVGLLVAAVGVGLAMVGFLVGCCVFSAPRHRGPTSGYFDGDRFRNQRPMPEQGSFLKWQWTRRPGPWAPVDAAPGPAPPRRVDAGRMRVTYVNHATVLVQLDGVNVLTDPIWSDRCSPVSWAGPHRVRPPGIRFEDLPPIDVVLVSHNHYDHLDLATLARLADRYKPRIFLGLGNSALLERERIAGGQDLDWGASAQAGPLRVSAVPVQHFSGRGLCDRNRTLWTGFVVEGPSGRWYFPGDTGFGPHFAEAASRFGGFRLALLPIGAFQPRWFMSSVHTSPDEAVRAHAALRASTSVAIHFGTFRLGDDGQDEAPRRLAEVLEASPPPRPRFWILGFGEGRDVPPVPE